MTPAPQPAAVVAAESSTAVLAMLPPPPASIALLGGGLGALATAMSAHGYAPLQLAEAWQDASPQSRESFSTLIVGALPNEVDALTLFTDAHDLLAMGGKLVLLVAAARQAAAAARQGVEPREFLTMVAGRHGFSLDGAGVPSGAYVFMKSVHPRWRISPVRAADVPAVLTLFREVFGHEMSAAHWRWKYDEARGSAAVARRDGKIVAHYGGVVRPILLFGKPARAFQICDVMVDLTERSVLTKSGPFFLTAASFAESAVTARSPFGFGFPSARVMRLAERTGLYTEVGAMTEIRWSPLPDRPRMLTRARHLLPDAADSAEVINRLWGEMARDLGDSVVGVRDAGYVRHRYFEHPDKRYDVVLVSGRFSGRAHGILVLRRDEGRCELLDVIAPLRRLPALLDQARRLISHWGFSELYGWITRQNAGRFTATGGQVHALDVRIPTSNWIDGPAAEAILDKWWLTGGDTDFH